MNWLKEFWSWLGNHRPAPALAAPAVVKESTNQHPRFNFDGVYGQITKNFNIDEFKTRDGTQVPEEFYGNVELLAENLQVLRDHVGKSIKIISGYRHPAYNRKVGGAKRSQHLTASAGDMVVKSMSPRKVADTISKLIKEGKMKKGGLGRYKRFCHYDVRPKNVRWGRN